MARSRDEEPLETFTVITTDPNQIIEPMHKRMPVILQPKDYDRWLAPGDPERPPVDLLRPFPAEQMISWKVDPKVGNVRKPDCVQQQFASSPKHAARWIEGICLRPRS
jgi:putative SOS response-associated peptidase YedK